MANVETIAIVDERATAPLPLANIRVLDLTRAWAGPSCAAFLGELGAYVLKVEAPEGEAMRGGGVAPTRERPRPYNLSAPFNLINRNKRGMAIDLTSDEGLQLFLDLVAESDVVVENFRPGVIDRLGLGFDALSQRNPRIILASNGGYGHEGPYSTFRGYGVAIEPMSGLFSVTGYECDRPQRSGVDHPDPQAGMSMATALLVAIYHAHRTGRGRQVKTSLLRAMAACFAPKVIEHLALGSVPTRHGNDSNTFSPHGVYPCAGSDQWVALAVTSDDEWKALCTAIRREDLYADARLRSADARRAQRAVIDKAIAAWTHTHSKQAVEHELQERGVPAAADQSVTDLLADDQLASRSFFREVEQTDWGTRTHIGPRVQLDGRQLPVRPAPRFAQDTAEVLEGWLGLAPAELHRLDEKHVVPQTPWRHERLDDGAAE